MKWVIQKVLCTCKSNFNYATCSKNGEIEALVKITHFLKKVVLTNWWSYLSISHFDENNKVHKLTSKIITVRK